MQTAAKCKNQESAVHRYLSIFISAGLSQNENFNSLLSQISVQYSFDIKNRKCQEQGNWKF